MHLCVYFCMQPTRRRELLLELLAEGDAKSQNELLDLLSEHGVEVTQATVSRDLAAIGAVKSSAGYSLPGSPIPVLQDIAGVLRNHAVSVVPADSLVVVKTAPGHAAIVGDALDACGDPRVVGTIAGENTVLVATPSKSDAAKLAKKWTQTLSAREAA